MSFPSPAIPTQSTLWNGHAGNAWVDLQPILDGMFLPLQQRLLDAVRHESPRRVLDVGCGTGSTTLAIARLVGSEGQCTGIDIAQPMVTAARARAERESVAATFIQADAQTCAFEPHGVDMIVSRFGVMFFERPIDAFANLRRASRPSGLLNVIAWRGAAENPFMTTAERAVAPMLDLPPRQPGAPGQFAFANKDQVGLILRDSGWHDIDIQPVDVECTLPARDLADVFCRLGPVGLALQQADEATRAKVIDAVRPAFDSYVQGDEVRYTAACWVIRARPLPKGERA
ncbi:class I SAM-dependent methyltransferase [Dyella japonica]|uniref:SAM-dependent methyltransferase n=1 Tax=Dyella japonica A8 TaxID=1217721 RepID=A0A075K7A0_9GAMM|nr:class I SAM-dependent methyltransferase [Dyella japonica]AIF49522.1 SAM-dependent methyltransferase [Dyella japonica A8]